VSDENPTWSPDGRTLVFASHAKGGNAQIFQKASTGEGQAEPVLQGTGNEHPIDWSPDGKFLLLHSDQGFEATLDMLLLPISGDRKIRPFHATQFREGQGRISPDGKWVAYTSGESGRLEVYMKSFTGGAGKWQISSAGGAEPRWRKDGKELFYVALDGMMMAVEVHAGESIEVLQSTPLFDTHLPPADLNHYGGTARYDVSHDGTRFLINSVVVPASPPTLNVITNWNPPRTQQ
jgi:Tol biopolymer transport system component